MDFLGVPKQYTRITNQTRRSIVDAIESGATLRDIAETFNVKYSTIRSVNRVWRREGRIEKKKKYMLDSIHRDRLLEWLKINRKRSPDELKQLFTTEFGLKPSKSTIYRALNILRQDYCSKQCSSTCPPQNVENFENQNDQDDAEMTYDDCDSSHDDNFSATSNVSINDDKCTQMSTGSGYEELIIPHDDYVNNNNNSNQHQRSYCMQKNDQEENIPIFCGPDRCFISTRALYLHRCLQSDSVLE